MDLSQLKKATAEVENDPDGCGDVIPPDTSADLAMPTRALTNTSNSVRNADGLIETLARLPGTKWLPRFHIIRMP